jgi:hypothetical protein
MDTTYFLLLATTLIFPLIGLSLAKFFPPEKIGKSKKVIILFFAVHNIAFLLGFSLKGQLIDYYIFAVEYLAFCYSVFASLKYNYIYLRIYRALGVAVIAIVFIVGLPGIIFFIIATQEMIPDRTFHFKEAGKTYETKRYTIGFATTSNTRYTFQTFRTYKYLPIELCIDKTDFIDTETHLRIGDEQLRISIDLNDSIPEIIFSDKFGNSFKKPL